jgi:hypothetical protein
MAGAREQFSHEIAVAVDAWSKELDLLRQCRDKQPSHTKQGEGESAHRKI